LAIRKAHVPAVVSCKKRKKCTITEPDRWINCPY